MPQPTQKYREKTVTLTTYVRTNKIVIDIPLTGNPIVRYDEVEVQPDGTERLLGTVETRLTNQGFVTALLKQYENHAVARDNGTLPPVVVGMPVSPPPTIQP